MMLIAEKNEQILSKSVDYRGNFCYNT